ncbi:hypothetical protein DFH08DRAFT_882024 [Mycena albidolilacea]|uniref:Uncharacterized protein n=1 Tax=Mycena albidolilacea TaxID=1033008 RepID=A0AAD6ZN68_9AGAR|nr:hypothetical protein DFH08DRAFT_882024 [Mycena albidolilacea]
MVSTVSAFLFLWNGSLTQFDSQTNDWPRPESRITSDAGLNRSVAFCFIAIQNYAINSLDVAGQPHFFPQSSTSQLTAFINSVQPGQYSGVGEHNCELSYGFFRCHSIELSMRGPPWQL